MPIKKDNSKENAIKTKSTLRLFFLLYPALVFLSVILLWSSWVSHVEDAENLTRSEFFAMKSALDIEKISSLQGTAQDESTEAYKSIKSTLYNIAADDSEIRFASLYTKRDGKLYFLADSEASDSSLYSPPGREYTKTEDAYYKAFENGEFLIMPVVKEEQGFGVNVLNPLVNDSGDIVAVLSVDYSAMRWYRPAITGFIQTVSIVLIVFLLAITTHVLLKKNYLLNAGQEKLEQANENIKNREEKYRSIFEYAPVGIYNFDKNALIVDCNDYFVNIIGSSRKNLIGLNLLSLPDSKIVECVKATLRGESAEYRDIYHSTTADKDTPIHGLFSPILSNSGAVIGGTGIVEDITERKRLGDELRLKSLVLDQLEERITITNLDGIITYANKIQADVLGLPVEEIVGSKTDLYGEDTDRGASQREILETTLKEGVWRGEVVNYTAAGQELIVDCRTQLICNVEGEKVALAGIAADITGRKMMEKDLFNEKEQLKTTLLSIGDGVIATDAEGRITMLNRIAEDLTGFRQNEASGKQFEEVFHIIDEISGELAENPLNKALTGSNVFKLSNPTILIARDGTRRFVEDSASLIKNEQGDTQGVVLAFRDVSEKRRRQKEIEYLSFHDQLTGLYNRRYYEQEVQRLDDEKYYPLTLVMSDVNGLKLTNDAFGHIAGDLLIRRIAEIMKHECRSTDVVARIGGDEFVLLLPETDAKHAETIIARINTAIANEQSENYVMSIAVGYAVKEDSDVSMNEIFTKAEDAMYRNKRLGNSTLQSKTINRMMSSLFEKDEKELHHSERVGELCRAIATEMGFSQPDIDQMRLAGHMHDIGKIGLSEMVPNPERKRKLVEWNEIERHPEIGYRILGSLSDYSKIADYVLEHHERLDGKGYPRGLIDNEISLQAKIITIADAYDAMTSDIPSGRAMSKEEAIKEIKENSGTQFDRSVAEVFVEMVLGEKWDS